MNLELTDWLLAAVSALVVGLSKTGLVGIGIVGSIALTLVLPAKVVTGAILPMPARQPHPSYRWPGVSEGR